MAGEGITDTNDLEYFIQKNSLVSILITKIKDVPEQLPLADDQILEDFDQRVIKDLRRVVIVHLESRLVFLHIPLPSLIHGPEF